MPDVDALIASVESATEGSRELDLLVGDFDGYELGWLCADQDENAMVMRKRPVGQPLVGRVVNYLRRYTRSIDAAGSLLPTGVVWSLGQRKNAPGFVSNTSAHNKSCIGATPGWRSASQP